MACAWHGGAARWGMRCREERLRVSTDDVPAHLMEIVDGSGARSIEQKVTHALHSGFGRTIADHFISCYLLLKEWGCDDDVCVAGLLHASYRRGDGLQAVQPSEMRPVWQKKLNCTLGLPSSFPGAGRSTA